MSNFAFFLFFVASCLGIHEVSFAEEVRREKEESLDAFANNLFFSFTFTPEEGIFTCQLAARRTPTIPIWVDAFSDQGPSYVSFRLYHRGKQLPVDIRPILRAQFKGMAARDRIQMTSVYLDETTVIQSKKYIWNFIPGFWPLIGDELDKLAKPVRERVEIEIFFGPTIFIITPLKSPLYTGITIAPASTENDEPDAFSIRMTSATYDRLRLKEKNAKEKEITRIDKHSAIRLTIPPKGVPRYIKAYFSEFDEELAPPPAVIDREELYRRMEAMEKAMNDPDWQKKLDRIEEESLRRTKKRIKEIVIEQGLDPNGPEAKRMEEALELGR